MKKDKPARADELPPKYDLKSLEVRRLGARQKSFGDGVTHLDPDVIATFPSAESVNEALRFLIRITKSDESTSRTAKDDV